MNNTAATRRRSYIFSTLMLAMSFLCIMMYWFPLKVGEITIQTQTLSIFFLTAILLANARAAERLVGVLSNNQLRLSLLYLAVLFITCLINGDKDVNWFTLVKIGYTIVQISLMAWALTVLYDESPISIPNAAILAIVGCFTLITLVSGQSGVTVLDIYALLGKMQFIELTFAWRRIFTLGVFEVGDTDIGNFRNGVAAAFFTVLCIAGQKKGLLAVALQVLFGVFIISTMSLSGTMLAVAFFLFRFVDLQLSIDRLLRVIGLAAVIMLLLQVWLFISANHLQTISEYYFPRLEQSSDSRMEINEIALQKVWESPVFGYYPGYKIADSSGVAQYPHNSFIGIWLTAGVPALAVYCTLFGTILIGFLRGVAAKDWLGTPSGKVIRLAGLGLAAILIRANIGSSFESLFDYGSSIALSNYLAMNKAVADLRERQLAKLKVAYGRQSR